MSAHDYLRRVASNLVTQLGYYPDDRHVVIAGINVDQRLVASHITSHPDNSVGPAFDPSPGAVVARLERHGAQRFIVMGVGTNGPQRAINARMELELYRGAATGPTITIAVQNGGVHALNSKGQWTLPAMLRDFRTEAAYAGVAIDPNVNTHAARYRPDPIPSWSPLKSRRQLVLDTLAPAAQAQQAVQLLHAMTADGDAGTPLQRAQLAHLMLHSSTALDAVAAHAALSPETADALHTCYVSAPSSYQGILGPAAGYAHLVAHGTTLGAITMSSHDTPHAAARALATATVRLAHSPQTADEMRAVALEACRISGGMGNESDMGQIMRMLDASAPVLPHKEHNTVGAWNLVTTHDHSRDSGRLDYGILER